MGYHVGITGTYYDGLLLHNFIPNINRMQAVDNNSEEVDRLTAVRKKNTGINNTHDLRQRELVETYFGPNDLKIKINAVYYFKIHFLVSQKTQSSVQKISQLTPFKERTTVFSETPTKRVYINSFIHSVVCLTTGP